MARSPALLRTAWMLPGDAALAEDLLQTALARTWPHWDRVRTGQPETYVRTVMVRTNASWPPTSPEDAGDRQSAHAGKTFTVPVYESDGETRIGELTIGG